MSEKGRLRTRLFLYDLEHSQDLIEAACARLAEAPLQSQDCAIIRLGDRRRSVEQH